MKKVVWLAFKTTRDMRTKSKTENMRQKQRQIFARSINNSAFSNVTLIGWIKIVASNYFIVID